MTDLNRCTLMGRLTKDVELKGVAYKFTIAVNRSFKKDEEWKDDVSYIDVTTFNLSDKKQSQMTKGAMVIVEGSIKQDRWVKDGQKFSKVGVLAQTIWVVKAHGESANAEAMPQETTQETNSGEEFPEDLF